MSEEFKALETFNYIMTRCKDEDSYIIKFPLGIQKGTTFGEDMEKAYKVIKDALQRLEAIDNAKPSEALELVNKMANYILLDEEYGFIDDEEKQAIIRDRDTIEQALIKAQEQEKVLKSIKEHLTFKGSGIEEYTDVLTNQKVKKYCIKIESKDTGATIHIHLDTQEEFDTLKRWVENESR